MPTKTRQVLFPGENKEKLSTCKKEAERMVYFITSNLLLFIYFAMRKGYFQP